MRLTASIANAAAKNRKSRSRLERQNRRNNSAATAHPMEIMPSRKDSTSRLLEDQAVKKGTHRRQAQTVSQRPERHIRKHEEVDEDRDVRQRQQHEADPAP